MDTATVSVVASSVVAVAAIASTWLQHRAGLKHERTVVDLDNVRDVLDEGAVVLHRIAYVLDDLRSQLTPRSMRSVADRAELPTTGRPIRRRAANPIAERS